MQIGPVSELQLRYLNASFRCAVPVRIVDEISPGECRIYIQNAGYASAKI
jgi:hypothetical protein